MNEEIKIKGALLLTDIVLMLDKNVSSEELWQEKTRFLDDYDLPVRLVIDDKSIINQVIEKIKEDVDGNFKEKFKMIDAIFEKICDNWTYDQIKANYEGNPAIAFLGFFMKLLNRKKFDELCDFDRNYKIAAFIFNHYKKNSSG
jgi:hypothetical protein